MKAAVNLGPEDYISAEVSGKHEMHRWPQGGQQYKNRN